MSITVERFTRKQRLPFGDISRRTTLERACLRAALRACLRVAAFACLRAVALVCLHAVVHACLGADKRACVLAYGNVYVHIRTD